MKRTRAKKYEEKNNNDTTHIVNKSEKLKKKKLWSITCRLLESKVIHDSITE